MEALFANMAFQKKAENVAIAILTDAILHQQKMHHVIQKKQTQYV